MKKDDLIPIPPATDDEPTEALKPTPPPTKTIKATSASPAARPLVRLRSASPATILTAGIVVVILVGLLGFGAGIHYQKTKAVSAAALNTPATANRPGQPGISNGPGGFSRRGSLNGSFGTVTAISSSNISVQDRRSDSVKTYSIDSSTKVVDGTRASTSSNISVGDSVVVTTSSSTSTTAMRIVLNAGPGMGAPSGATDGSTGSDSGSTQSNI